MADTLLAMLAKPPVPGRVKTRLTRDGAYSADEAARLYAACLRDATARLACPERWRLVVVHPPGEPGDALRELVDQRAEVRSEPVITTESRDLGAVIADLVAAGLEAGAGKVAVIGSDAPHLPRERIDEALARLDHDDLVLGPDEGGGCYLIGGRVPLDWLTATAAEGPVAWSRGTDHDELRRRAARRGLRCGRLPACFDLDEPSDVDRLRAELAAGTIDGSDLPHVRAVLAALGPRRPQVSHDASGLHAGSAAGADAQPADDPVL